MKKKTKWIYRAVIYNKTDGKIYMDFPCNSKREARKIVKQNLLKYYSEEDIPTGMIKSECIITGIDTE